VDILLREDLFNDLTIQDILLASKDWQFDREKYMNGVTQRNLSRLYVDNFKKQDEY
jgi:hypothetical protein